MHMSSRHRRQYTAIALGGLATIGLWEGAKGVLLPNFLSSLSLLPAAGATILSASAIGNFVGATGFGAVSQRLGLRRSSMLGGLLMGTAALLFLTVRLPALLYGAFLLYGLGLALVELTIQIPVSVLYGQQQGGIFNLLHGFFGIGALAGSAWGALMLSLGAGWRQTAAVTGGCVLFWVLFYRSLPEVPLPREEAARGGNDAPVLRDPLTWVLALSLVAAVVAEIGCSLWLPTYLQQVKGLAEATAAMGATTFYLGFTATRLAGPWLVGHLGSLRALVLTALLGAAGLGGVLLLPGCFYWLSALAGSGIAIGFATCLTLAASRHPSRVNTAFSVMYAGGSLAGIGTGPAMGWIAQTGGLGAAMVVPMVCYFLIGGLVSFYGWAERRGLWWRAAV
jgi:fucose permease